LLTERAMGCLSEFLVRRQPVFSIGAFACGC
jgi:hypothetical protein